jgi:hypothetical protein
MSRKRPSVPAAAWGRGVHARKIVSYALRAQGEGRAAKAAPMSRGLWPSEAAVARVLDATGRKFVPSGLDPNALRADLNRHRGEILAKQIDTAAYRKGHKKAAARTGKQAAGLRALLKNSGNRLFDRQLWFALDLGEYDLAIALCAKIESEAERIAGAGITAQYTGDATKPHIVKLLAPIFKAHFGRDPGKSRHPDGGEIYGPFIRFVQAVGREIHIKISLGTIEAALAGLND